jgi:hypothetical protein
LYFRLEQFDSQIRQGSEGILRKGQMRVAAYSPLPRPAQQQPPAQAKLSRKQLEKNHHTFSEAAILKFSFLK